MTPRQARLSVDIFTGAVVASVALALANFTWRLTGDPGIGPAAAPVVARGGRAVDIAPLVAMAPFGTAVLVTGSATSEGAVRLKAIFLARPMEASVVLLATADGKVANYGIGSVVGGGVIESIAAEQITLRMPDGLQTIGFNPESNGAPVTGAQAPSGASALQPVFNQTAPAAPPPAANGVDGIRALIPPSTQGLTPSRAAPPAPVGAPPQASAGETGFRIGVSPPPAMLNAGIRAGDIIQRVNGTAVTSATNEREVMARAMSSGTARVELLRNGQPISLTVPFR